MSALVEYVGTEGKDWDTDSENFDVDVSVPGGPTFKLQDYETKMVNSLKDIEESFVGCLETHSDLKDESIQILKANPGLHIYLGIHMRRLRNLHRFLRSLLLMLFIHS